MLVRGEDRYGHFDDERRPTDEAGPAERAFHAEAVARFRSMNAVESSENKVAVVKRIARRRARTLSSRAQRGIYGPEGPSLRSG